MRYSQLLFERNIINIVEIEQFVNQMAARAQNPNVERWVRTMLPNFLKKTYKKLQKVQAPELPKYFPKAIPDWAQKGVQIGDLFSVQIDPELRDQVSQTIDYLESDAANHNLSRIPFETAMQKSHEWHQRLASQSVEASPNLGPGKGMIFKAYPSGFKWVLLTTPACLDQEGKIMGNCVGGGSYDQGLTTGSLKIYSLRDADGDSHVTAAIEGKTVREIKGKQNKVPIPKYVPYVIDLLNMLPLQTGGAEDWNGSYDLRNMGIFKGPKGFGDVLAVAQSTKPIPTGNIWVTLNPKQMYIVGKNGNLLVNITLSGPLGSKTRDARVKNLNVEQNVEPKSVQKDVDYVLHQLISKGVKIEATAAHSLLTTFGMVISGGTTLESATAGMKFIEKDLFHAAYIGPKELMVVDNENHPLIFMAFGTVTDKNRLYESYSLFQAGWVDAIPLFLKAITNKNVTLDRGTWRKLKQENWFNEGGSWVHGKDIVANLQPVFDNWYKVRNELWLYDGKVKGVMYLKDANDEDVYRVNGVDDDFNVNAREIADAVVEIFEEGVAEISDSNYGDDPFLINYDVYSDGDGSFVAVDFQSEVTITTTWYNERGDETKEVSQETTFGAALSQMGHDSDAYFLNRAAGSLFYYNGSYDDERDLSPGDSEDDIEYYYDDPAQYREDHMMKKNAKLPYIANETTSISR